jgi:uncharacterized radical SAM protein YgiQ
VELSSYEEVLLSKKKFASNFRVVEKESNLWSQAYISEPCNNRFVVVNPPYPPDSYDTIDAYYDLPYTRQPHFRYKGKHISAYEMIKNSVTTHRGCFGSCSFCTISAHQGKFILSRSMDSIMRELESISLCSSFDGVVSDIGGPTANMYMMGGKDLDQCKRCRRASCIYPSVCVNLDISHASLLTLYKRASSIRGIRHAYVASGIRYDLFLNEKGYLNKEGKSYLEEIIINRTPGRLKVAPEHTEKDVLKYMGKPTFESFSFLRKEFDAICKKNGKRHLIIPYFISSHPGCSVNHMKSLAANKELKGIRLEQVQDFTPTPMTRSSAIYYSGLDLYSMEKVFVERDLNKKRIQKSFFKNKT